MFFYNMRRGSFGNYRLKSSTSLIPPNPPEGGLLLHNSKTHELITHLSPLISNLVNHFCLSLKLNSIQNSCRRTILT